MRERQFKLGIPLCVFSSLTLLAACQDPPPAFEERTFDQNNLAQASDSADATAAHQEVADNGDGRADPKVITKKFSAAQSEDVTVAYVWGGETADETIKMSYETMGTTTSVKQIDAPQHTELFTQTAAGGKASETFEQKSETSGVLDILVVIDNSGSMAEEQQNLSTKLSPMMQYVKDSQWRIGVVTTDPRDGCMRALIQKGDVDADQAYAQAINAGTKGSGSERGLAQAVDALKCNGGSWLRQNSTLAVLIVSDEDNCSNGIDCAGEPQASGSYLTDYLNSIRQVGVTARVYGIVWRSTDSAAQCPTAYNQANVYSDIVTHTNGTLGSICDRDYTLTLEAISKNMSVLLKNQFAIQHIPLDGTLKIFINDQLLTNGYTITGNVVELKNAPAIGSIIRFEYEYLADSSRKEFLLAKAATPVGMAVYGDGVLVDSSLYKYDQVQHSVNFNDIPAAHEIKVVYYEQVALPQDFAIKDEFVRSSLKVTVDGVLQDASAYQLNADPQGVHFNASPLPGVTIDMAYDKIIKPRLRYPVIVASENMQIAEVIDGATSEKLDYTLEGNVAVFDEKDFEVGRVILVHYRTDMTQKNVVDLQSSMVAGTPVIVSSSNGTTCDVSSSIVGSKVNMGQCGFSVGEHITITFSAMLEPKRLFAVEDEALSDPDKFVWTVMVNGQPTVTFERDQNVITIEGLKTTDEVTVTAKANM